MQIKRVLRYGVNWDLSTQLYEIVHQSCSVSCLFRLCEYSVTVLLMTQKVGISWKTWALLAKTFHGSAPADYIHSFSMKLFHCSKVDCSYYFRIQARSQNTRVAPAQQLRMEVNTKKTKWYHHGYEIICISRSWENTLHSPSYKFLIRENTIRFMEEEESSDPKRVTVQFFLARYNLKKLVISTKQFY